MGESVFEVVKQSVTAREAAELYGIAVGRGGMACCPFHDDRHPSMKVDTRFHCFGCGADGDVIDFTARLYDLSPKEAAEKLAQDFGLSYDSKAPIRRSYVRQKSEAQVRKEKREHGWRVLTDYYHLLRKWEADYSPKTADEDPHPRFLEAVQKKDYMGYLLDTFLDSSTEEQDQWIAEHTAEISAIEGRVNIMADKPTNRERLQQITAGIEQGIKELFESEKYMRYLSVMSRFHRYSVNNTMLIYMQKPDATLVAGYNKWKNQFERHVKRGEHGITIIAPTPFKKKIEEQKLDPDTKAPILDAEGKVVMEEREVEIPMFRPVKVFDVSQTDGKPLPELASSLSGNVQNYEAFMEALRRHRRMRPEQARQRALELLELVGIDDPEARMRLQPHYFSGGMRQRCVLAIALALGPRILLADEPTTALDVTVQARMLDLLRDVQRKTGVGIILVSHDLGVVARVADRVAVMYAGRLVETGSAADVFYDPRHPYTWGLLSAMPDLDTEDDRLYTIPGSPPNLLHPVPGDAFAPRNAYALNIDERLDPPLFQISETHYAASWLLDERAPKVEMPPELKARIERMKKEGI